MFYCLKYLSKEYKHTKLGANYLKFEMKQKIQISTDYAVNDYASIMRNLA